MRRILASLALAAALALAPAASFAQTYQTTTTLPRNYKAGFTLGVDATTPTGVVDVGPGQAADSTNAVALSNASAGSVNLGASGAGGLDTGSAQALTWYAIFEIQGPSGYSAIASAPAVVSTTGAITAASTTLGTASGTNVTAGSNITVQGAGPAGTNLNTTVSGAPTAVSVAPTGTTTNSSNSITSVSSIASVIPGLKITDSDSCIPTGTVITAASGSTITLSQNTNGSGCGSGDTLTITGDNVTLAAAAVTTVGETGGTTTNLTVPVWGVSSISGRPPMSPLLPNGYSYYRYIGSVLTNGSSQLVPWAQAGDEFWWLTAPSANLNAATITTQARLYTITAPVGVRVHANFDLTSGSAGGQLLAMSPDEKPQTAGSGLIDLGPSTTGSWRVSGIYTNTAGQIQLSANGAVTTTLIMRSWIEDWGRGS